MKANLTSNKFVAYYRVSTNDQKLGIDAQREIVSDYVANLGGVIVSEYEEHASGKIDNRPQLLAALDQCKKKGLTLIVAKIDRLTRRLSFGAALCDQCNIHFCDHPEINDDPLLRGVWFGLAEKERQLISDRTRAALAAKKAKGDRLGAPVETLTTKVREIGLKVRQDNARANDNNKRAWSVVEAFVTTGTMSLRKIASYLNERGFVTAKGGQWSAIQVTRLINLYKNL